MRRNAVRTSVTLVAILLLPLLGLVAQETSSLLIEGPQGQTRVIQVQGKNYVEVEQLARITGGSLPFVGNQIILTLPGRGHRMRCSRRQRHRSVSLGRSSGQESKR
jgi:hypothetical protein